MNHMKSEVSDAISKSTHAYKIIIIICINGFGGPGPFVVLPFGDNTKKSARPCVTLCRKSHIIFLSLFD